MATVATSRSFVSQALILMLGAAVFLNYVDRGAIGIAAPLLKSDLHLTAKTYGIAFSAFFWVYAPIQLFAGWLCDRFSVYRLIAFGIAVWAGSTLLTGFVGGFASLLVLRVMLGIGESISFPGSSKIIARHIPIESRGIANAAVAMGIALGPAVGTLAGGLIVASFGWRAMFIAFGLITLLWVAPWRRLVATLDTAELERDAMRVPMRALMTKWPLWAMSIGHCAGNYCFYFLLAWLPLYLVQSRGYSIPEMTLLATLGYSVQAVAALTYGHFSDRWTRSGRSEAVIRRWMMTVSQLVSAVAILGLAFAQTTVVTALLLCLAGAATASLSLNLYAIAQMFSGRQAAGTWVGLQNAFGNLSGIFGPILTGFIVAGAGYHMAFVVTAGIAAFGAIWWAIGVPKIEQVELH